MAGQSRAAQRRRQKKLRQGKTLNIHNNNDGKQKKIVTKSINYDSSDEENIVLDYAPIPLPSLETSSVRSFIDESNIKNNLNTKKGITHNRKRERDIEMDNTKKMNQKNNPIEEKRLRAEKMVWRKFDRENELFTKYYQNQFNWKENEWKQFIKSLCQPNSVYFRLNGMNQTLSETILGSLECDFDVNEKSIRMENGDMKQLNLHQVSFLHDENLWKININRKEFRKEQNVQALNDFINRHISIGSVMYDDIFNSIVATLIDIIPGNNILDLLGNGGTKIPMIMQRLKEENSTTCKGSIVINEIDSKVVNHTIQYLSKYIPDTSSIIITNHKTEEFPSCKDTGIFDRVICCPPSSADGMIRKHPETWRCWNPSMAWKHHYRQILELKKAMELVKIGGKVIYATRSINPIENEAIVAEILRYGNEFYKLVDVSNKVSDLKFHHGISSWKVMSQDMTNIESWTKASDNQKQSMQASMWSPTVEESEWMNLNQCLRILPHDQDTNGYFFAIFEKIKDIFPVSCGPIIQNTKEKKVKITKQSLKDHKHLDCYQPLSSTIIKGLEAFYHLPSSLSNRLLSKIEFSEIRTIHYLSNSAFNILKHFETSNGNLLNIIKPGGVLFRRIKEQHSTNSCPFYIPKESITTYIQLKEKKGAFNQFLQLKDIEKLDFEEILNKKEIWLTRLSKKLKKNIETVKNGASILYLEDSDPFQTLVYDFAIPIWKSHTSIRLLLLPGELEKIRGLMSELNRIAENGEEDGYDSMDSME